MSSGRAERTLAALFLLALVVRVGVIVRTDAIFNDGPHFLRLSELFAAGDWTAALSHHYHPLYPILTAAVSPLVGNLEIAALTISVLSGSATVLVLYAFVRRAFDSQTAWIAGVLLALHPYSADFSANVQSEGLYFAFFLGAVAWLWRAIENGRPAAAMVAGAMMGLAYLVRPEGLGLMVVAAAFALLRVAQGRWSIAASGRWLAVLGLAGAVFAGPYIVHLRVETGEWMLTQKKSFSQVTSSGEHQVEPEKATAPRAPGGVRSGPASKLRAPPREASLLAALLPHPGPARAAQDPRSLNALIELVRISQSALHLALVLLLAIGLYRLRGRPGDRGLFLAAVVFVYAVAAYGLVLNVGYLDRRHVLAPLIPLFGYAATGLVVVANGLLSRLHRGPTTARQRLQTICACIAVVALVTLPKTLSRHREERLATRLAGEWLAEQANLAGPVAAAKERTAWYAGEAFIPLPRPEAKVPAAYLRRYGVRFLIVDEEQLAQLERLKAAIPAEFRELQRIEAVGRTAVVYELVGAAEPTANEKSR